MSTTTNAQAHPTYQEYQEITLLLSLLSVIVQCIDASHAACHHTDQNLSCSASSQTLKSNELGQCPRHYDNIREARPPYVTKATMLRMQNFTPEDS